MKLLRNGCNIPNLISISRIVLIPLCLYLLLIPTRETRIWAFIVFVIASLTDMLDGWTARKLNQSSELGAFLDPFADKVLVIATLIAFLILDPFIPVWMVIVIVARDILITFMRYLASKRGKHLKTSRFGKIKTAFQMGSIAIIMMIYIERKSGVEAMRLTGKDLIEMTFSTHPDKWLLVAPYWIMLIVTILTVLSGARYVITNWDLFVSAKSDKAEQNPENH